MKINIGEPKIIGDYFGYFPYMFRLNDGKLIIRVHCGADDCPEGKELADMFISEESRRIGSDEYLRRIIERRKTHGLTANNAYWFAMSKDNGGTWTPYGMPNVDDLTELKDGSYFGIACFSLNRDGKEYLQVWRSNDKGESWTGPEHSEITGPPLAEGFNGIYFHRSIIELDNGDILLDAYTNFKGDTKNRSVIYRSTDRGKTFHYYSTVAYDPGVNSPHGINEPVTARTADGDFLCMMRTNAYLPMLQSRSDNNCATWSKPELSGVEGVDPDLALMSNGILACSYGRPGVWIMFDAEGNGRKWTDKTCIWANPHKGYRIPQLGNSSWHSEKSCGYTSICEVSPGRILLTYSAPIDPADDNVMTPWDSEQLKHFRIWGVFIDVEK